MMDFETYLRAVLDCNLPEVKDEIKEIIVKKALEYKTPTVTVENYAKIYQDGLLKGLSERPQGEWITDNLHNTICNRCGGIRRDNRVDYIAFCNKCGADMRAKNRMSEEEYLQNVGRLYTDEDYLGGNEE